MEFCNIPYPEIFVCIKCHFWIIGKRSLCKTTKKIVPQNIVYILTWDTLKVMGKKPLKIIENRQKILEILMINVIIYQKMARVFCALLLKIWKSRNEWEQFLEVKAMKKKKRIGKKVGNVVTIMLAVSIFAVVAICVLMFYDLVMDSLRNQCVDGTNVLAYEISRMSEDGDKTEMLDNLKSYMNMEFTIFEGDVRTYTTILQNGQRAVGTKLSEELSDIVLRKGESYVGNAEILGSDHVCSYVPIRDDSGKVSGLIFAGIASAPTVRKVIFVVIIAVVIAFLAIVACILILTVILKKMVSKPLGVITQVARRLEQGDLGLAKGEEIEIEVQSNDEIGELSHAFGAIIFRLRAYIGEIAQVLGAMAKGDLTVGTRQEYIGDFVSIKNSLNGIEVNLNQMMGQIEGSAEQVTAGAAQLANSAQGLAQGSTEQASTVEELAATISDISESAKKTAATAKEVGESVNQAGTQLDVSVEYVKEMNVAMERISASSDEIGKIIATIENIAFQTNILALNAAVEAARAGTAGKGFAVVADEVRNLATKSDESAKATKDLIDSSINAVHEGSEVVERVTTSLERTSEANKSVVTMMTTVVEAVELQTAAIGQVMEGIDQISAVVQTNSATSEECAATSEQLSSQANLLRRLLSTFRLKKALY